MASPWLVDGRAAGVDPTDRGLAYGDGVFETMAAHGGVVRRLDAHLARLAEGCRRLQIPAPDEALLREEIARHVPENGRAVVKLVVTRGAGARGYAPPAHPIPTRILGITPWPDHPAANYTDGIEVRTVKLRLGENPALAGLKHLCRLEQVLARLELRGTGADEGLMLDGRGLVVGGTACNVFAAHGASISTPRLDRCGVRGVMRGAVLERCAQLAMEARETDMAPEALYAADEVFVTNAVFGIWPVRRLDGRRFAPGPMTRALQRALDADGPDGTGGPDGVLDPAGGNAR